MIDHLEKMRARRAANDYMAGIPVGAIQVELDLKGFVNPMRKADDRVVPA